MLWMVNVIFLITSLSITTEVALVIPYAKFQLLSSLGHTLDIWIPVSERSDLYAALAPHTSYCSLTHLVFSPRRIGP